MSLGHYLRQEREKRAMSLRDVENALKRLERGVRVSSGHLSLIEQGKVAAPVPKTLHALALALGLDYITLMVEAGYLDHTVLEERPPAPAPAFRGGANLTPQQVRQVEEYIEFLRSRRHSPRVPNEP
jgi:transcriptional regulator with XRE-family HTH domain